MNLVLNLKTVSPLTRQSRTMHPNRQEQQLAIFLYDVFMCCQETAIGMWTCLLATPGMRGPVRSLHKKEFCRCSICIFETGEPGDFSAKVRLE